MKTATLPTTTLFQTPLEGTSRSARAYLHLGGGWCETPTPLQRRGSKGRSSGAGNAFSADQERCLRVTHRLASGSRPRAVGPEPARCRTRVRSTPR
jgi:hypothetical protein